MIKFRQTSTAFANRKTAPQPIAGHRTAILFVLNFSKSVYYSSYSEPDPRYRI